jgi:citrate lyase subunit beta/citryl-CoA lyase
MSDDAFELRRRQLTGEAEAALPLRFLAQQAHYTTPASDAAMVEKAVTQGLAPTKRILDKLGIEASALAARLGVEPAELEAVLSGPTHAPLVIVDGEDAQALREDTVARGRENAVRAFRELAWAPGCLRFYRPSGFELPFCVGDLTTVIRGAGPSLEGIVWPKAESTAEVSWLMEVLDELDPGRRLKLALLVESANGLESLADLVRLARPRLVSLIFGIVDYAADLGLPDTRNAHPVADWARARIVNVAGAVGVPAIDAMTFAYPVPSKELSPEQNKQRVIDRLVECYEDAVHGIDLGMSGKWVGHPAQLAMVKLAYRRALRPEVVEREIAKVEAYARAVANEKGATIIGGDMADRATDRHARAMLRRAVAWGALPRARARACGIVSEDD